MEQDGVDPDVPAANGEVEPGAAEPGTPAPVAAAGEEGSADAAATAAADAALPDEELDRVVEALLFASGEPLAPNRMAHAAGGVSVQRVRRAIDRLRDEYERQLRAFDVVEIAGGYRLFSRPEYHEYVARLEKEKGPERLTPAALETLAIVAYRQPIIRADIDAVRGVQSGAIVRTLLDRKLVRVIGRSEQPGRPLQYGTTRRFLDHFGLSSLKDLPRAEELKAP